MGPPQFTFTVRLAGTPATRGWVPGPVFAPDITWSERMGEGPAGSEPDPPTGFGDPGLRGRHDRAGRGA